MENDLEQSGKKSCSMCGAIDGDFWNTEPFRLCQLKLRPRYGDVTQNWIICDECDEGLQDMVALPKPDRIFLLTQIRRATIDDRKAVLNWLLQKFNLEAGRKN